MKLGGYMGRVLRVDLERGAFEVEDPSRENALRFLGGRGLASQILMDRVNPSQDPLGPESPLVFMSGPVTGLGPLSGRHVVSALSPLTGTLAHSVAGDFFGVKLKHSGFDGVILQGRAEHPVYLSILDGVPALHDAQALWGLTTHQTDEALQRAFRGMAGYPPVGPLWYQGPEVSVACIGPAGEKGVLYACVMNDKHAAAARYGLGAVMGSKNLKALVVGGRQAPAPAEPRRLAALREELIAPLMGRAMQGFRLYGTSSAEGEANLYGLLPTRNFQGGQMEGCRDLHVQLLQKWNSAERFRYDCPLNCQKLCQLGDELVDRPEYETLYAFTSLVGNNDLETALRANHLCNTLGLDSISTGVSIAFAMECYQRGLLSRQEAGGLDLSWGNREAILALVEAIARRQGLGGLLALGVRRAAGEIGRGSEAFAMHTNGAETPGYDPRGIFSMGLGYATSSRRGHHCEAYTISRSLWEAALPLGVAERPDRFDSSARACRLVAAMQDEAAVLDSMVVCFFGTVLGAWTLEDLHRWLSLVLGRSNFFSSPWELKALGERVFNLERLFHLRRGLSRQDDTLPRRLLSEELPEGPSSGRVVPLDAMLDEYYNLRGWDREGYPTAGKLRELGLGEYVGHLPSEERPAK